MVFTDKRGRKFTTDKDLRVRVLGFSPGMDVENPDLAKEFGEKYERDFFGGDELVSYAQQLVSSGMDFGVLEKDILKNIQEGNWGLRHLRYIEMEVKWPNH
jgi:hypothetical protein